VEYLGITWTGILATFLITLALGVVCGLFNGVLVAKLRIPAFIATLGTLYVLRGSAYLVTNSQPYVINQQITTEQYALFNYLGTGTILGLPFSFWVMLLCAAVGGIVLRKMKLGRDTLASGNSVEASRLSGINIDRTNILVFTLLGGFVGIAAILNTCYLASENAGMLQGFEFDVITTVVLGGTALAGGKGNIFNSMSAALFFETLTVGMPLIGIGSYPQRIIQGAILLFAFSINEIRAQMESRRVKAGARRAAALKAASQS
jgi:ribose/xylose/arabinose/galactoside ABC-type transport system permease subunit